MIGGQGTGRGPIRLGNTNGTAEASIDLVNLALVAMDEIHNNIHRGIMYSTSNVANDVANNNSEEILIATSGIAHARVTLSVSAQCSVAFYEDAVVSASGTRLAAINRNRASSDVSTKVASFRAPTIVSDGTPLYSGLAMHAPGAHPSLFEEWILASNTSYLLRVTNTSGGTADLAIELDYYEPTT